MMEFDVDQQLEVYAPDRDSWIVGTTVVEWYKNPRELVILVACDVERGLKDLVGAFLDFLGGTETSEGAKKELIGGSGKWVALGRLNGLGFRLGLVTKDEYDDLERIVSLRNKYAHSSELGNYCEQDETCALIRDCTIYRNYRDRIVKVQAPDKDQVALHFMGAVFAHRFQVRASRLREKQGMGFSALPIGPQHTDW